VRHFILIPALLMVFAMMPTAASAQSGLGAPDFQDRFTAEFEDPDFCGTGVTVQGVEKTISNGWEDADTFKLTFRSTVSLSYGDRTIFLHGAGRSVFELIEGEFGSAQIDLGVENGVRAFVRVPGQGAVTLDHGLLKYVVELNEFGDVVNVELLKDAGGHPDFTDGVFCEAAVAGLGIPTT
jgi:hypothetical protein